MTSSGSSIGAAELELIASGTTVQAIYHSGSLLFNTPGGNEFCREVIEDQV